MKIGKFKIEPQYDMQCDICGEYRSSIGFSHFLSEKPTAKMLRSEGWTIVPSKLSNGSEVELQLCPSCSGKKFKERIW